MAITPRDLRNKQFNSGLRGYDATDVRDFLEDVAGELENLKREKLNLQERLAGANERLQTIRKRENQVQGLLETAERTARDRMAAIQSKGQALLAQAHAEAEEIVMRARWDRAELQDDVSVLQAQRERFRAELKAQLRAHADLLVRTGGGTAGASTSASTSTSTSDDGVPADNEFDGYDEFGEVAEILEGPPVAVDIDLGAGRTGARASRRARLRRASERSQAQASAQTPVVIEAAL